MTAFRQFASTLGSTLSLLLLLAGAVAVVFVRTGSAAGGVPVSVDDMRTAAADSLEAAIRPGGGGISFEVVQRSTLYAREDGPQIEVQDPDDRTKVIALVDELYLFSVVSRGAVTGDAFWMEMRGTREPTPDFSAAEFFARVLEQGGTLWRDDGVGWYVTDVSPGTGMDPATARLLPTLLRSLGEAAAVEPRSFDGKLLTGIMGVSSPAAYPGLIASDGAAFTEPAFDVDFRFDDQGRLVRIEASAGNLNQETYDLVIHTVVTFSYEDLGDPPAPNPTMAPEVLPTDDPEMAEVPG